MPHTLDTSQQNNSLTTNPATFNFTAGAGATGLILSLVVVGATARTGGTPTCNGIPMERVDTNRIATETNVEMWFMPEPTIGVNTISIPNSNTRTIHAFTSSIKAQSGYTSILDGYFGNTGTAANPSLPITTIKKDGCFIHTICGHGIGTLTGVSGNKTRYGTVWGIDHGAYCSVRMYELQVAAGLTTHTFTVTADDWASIIAAFREVPIVFNNQTYPISNTRKSGNIPIPLNATVARVYAHRRGWAVGSLIMNVLVEISFDGGLTWPYWKGFGTDGGNVISTRTGNIIPHSSIPIPLAEPTNPNRVARVNFTNTRDIDTNIKLEFE